uniref:Uncharacterized protein n=1 Tax=Oryza sativa subsp. japonica TaxID=39947 RepID=Q6EU06_ORYSJ|nr:hypothetical protein [Oryza sativa Japonica Group]BAD27864.1 hypothetical protein [Oryza sativa Japonica Group]
MINNPAQVGLAEVQQIKVARTPTVLRPTHSGKGPISLKDESNRGRVALPFKMASSSQAKQGGIILRLTRSPLDFCVFASG